MGLMRALTLKRANRTGISTAKGRPQISLPTELISSTNNLSFTAPSVEDMQHEMAAATLRLDAIIDSETTSFVSEDSHSITATPATRTESANHSRRSSHVSNSSEPSLTDASSVSSSPSSPGSHRDEHLGFTIVPQISYFAVDTLKKPSTYEVQLEDSVDPLTVVVPALPRRAPSHSKREHERLARRRSQRNSVLGRITTSALVPRTLQSPVLTKEVEPESQPQSTDSISPTTALTPTSRLPEVQEETAVVEIVSSAPEQKETEDATATQHFSQELERLLGDVAQMSLPVQDEEDDEDIRVMRERGLTRFSVGGYLDVVGDVWGSPFDDVFFGEVAVGA